MNTANELDTKLGPVDTGPDETWFHWMQRAEAGVVGMSYCGIEIKSHGDGRAPGRECPDCARIRGAR